MAALREPEDLEAPAETTAGRVEAVVGDAEDALHVAERAVASVREVARVADSERRRANLFAELVRVAAEQPSLERVVDWVLDATIAHLGATVAHVYAASEARRELRLLAHRGLSPAGVERRRSVSFDAPLLAARAARERRPQLVGSVDDLDPSMAEASDEVFRGASAIASLPLFALGRLEGVITYALPAPKAFDAGERATLVGLAAVLGLALASGEVGTTVGRFEAQIDALVAADLALTETLATPYVPLDAVLHTVAKQALRVAGARYAGVGVDPSQDPQLVPRAFAGTSAEDAARIGRSPRAVGLLELVSETGRAIRAARLGDHPALCRLPDGDAPTGAFLGVPVRYGGAAIGNLYVGDKIGGGEFGDEDEAAVELFALRAGMAVRLARLRAECERMADADTIFVTAPHALLLLDVRSERVLGNPRAHELLDGLVSARPVDVARALRMPDGAPFEDERHPVARALRGTRTLAVEARLVSAHRPEMPLFVSAAPIPGDADDAPPRGAVVVCEDLRPQVELRAELETARERLATVIEHQPIAVVYVELDGRIVAANPRATALVGRDLVGTSVDEPLFAYPGGLPLAEHDRPIRRALAGDTVTAMEVRVLRPDHAPLVAVVSATPVRGDDGAVSGAVLAFERASASDDDRRRRDEWVAMVAHDLRQPLSVVQMCVQLLQRKGGGAGPEGERLFDRTHRALTQLDRMIGDLLDVARIDAGQLRIDRRPVELGAIVREAAERVAAVDLAPVLVHARGAPGLVAVDARRVEQLVANLVGNAVKYGDVGAPIRVGVDVAPPWAELTVDNAGPPIPEADRVRLFSRFFRAKDVGARRGTGLGLFICKAIAEAHGGSIECERTEDERTRFRVRLRVG
jgi:PAS domain S-box-containing protein